MNGKLYQGPAETVIVDRTPARMTPVQLRKKVLDLTRTGHTVEVVSCYGKVTATFDPPPSKPSQIAWMHGRKPE